MSVLLIDAGNSAIKWRYVAGAHREEGSWLHRRQWRELPQELLSFVPDNIWLASVAGQEANQALMSFLESRFSCRVRQVHSEGEVLGVRSGYLHPERLGIDRWLGIIEGFHLSGACVVIDAGSAITLDAVDASGQHLGGYILPGLALMERALLGETAEVRFEAGLRESTSPGCTTQQAVQNGALMMAVASIERAVAAFQNSLQDTCDVLMTGGDAALLSQHLKLPVIRVSNLVLSGLERLANNSTGV